MSDDRASRRDPCPSPPTSRRPRLSRHGESTWITEGRFQGAADPPLSGSANGRRRCGARLAHPRRPPAVARPARPAGRDLALAADRTTATAFVIGAALTVPLTPEPDLREIAQGDWEGRLVAEILASDGERLRTWRHRPVGHEAPGGEALIDVDVRARRALTRVIVALTEASLAMGGGDPDRAPVIGYGGSPATRPWGLIVGHDGLMRVAMLALLGLPLERFWTFPFVPAGITVIEFHGGLSIVRAHDLDDHLAPLQAPAAADSTVQPDAREGAL